MSTALIEQFRVNPDRSGRLIELMNACRIPYRVITVTAIGCGDAFINRYWPTLEQLVNRDLIKLTIVDRGDLKTLVADKIEKAKKETVSAHALTELYGRLITATEQRPSVVTYINLEDSNGSRKWYEHLTQDVVFVLVPDNFHIQFAKDWLRRAILILIEKPYNQDFHEASTFEQNLKEMVRMNGETNPHTFVVCIDHYLAKIFDYVMGHRTDILQQKIGVVKRIEFSICEAGGVEPWRAAALNAGMIYDLFCHILALISPFVNLKSFLASASSLNILVAKHDDCPIASESFAHIIHNALLDLHGRHLTFEGSLGKGIGVKDEKFLRIIGEHGALYADFGPGSSGNLTLETPTGNVLPLFPICKGHPEIIKAVFQGRFMQEPVGGLTGETALDILGILTSLRTKVNHRLPDHKTTYPVGSSLADIKKMAVRL